jgi:hypothetical protein
MIWVGIAATGQGMAGGIGRRQFPSGRQGLEIFLISDPFQPDFSLIWVDREFPFKMDGAGLGQKRRIAPQTRKETTSEESNDTSIGAAHSVERGSLANGGWGRGGADDSRAL